MYSFELAPRCGAKTKHNNGKPCRCPAVKDKSRCRLHGGGKGSGAPMKNINSLKHGATTAQVKAFQKDIRLVLQYNKNLIKEFKL